MFSVQANKKNNILDYTSHKHEQGVFPFFNEKLERITKGIVID